ncbi:hypothetical protein ACFQ08_03890 [Streptosporangium algeriense]|uniref:Uncharacterized protein n=1 Tax=Streptosporangium algeriense TaxID=1682748 RepID=A0ABW3DL36_9ACTN
MELMVQCLGPWRLTAGESTLPLTGGRQVRPLVPAGPGRAVVITSRRAPT